jgi:small-conductance mechanosensitive channel
MINTDMFANSLKLMLDKFLIGIPTLIVAIIVFVIGLMISKAVFKIVSTFLKTLGIDKFGEKLNEIEFVNKSGIKILLSTVVGKMIYYMLLLIFTVLATDILQMPALSKLVSSTIEFFPNLLVSLVLMVGGLLGADALRKIALTALNSLGIPSAKVISSFLFYFMFITVFIMALSQLGINTAFLAQNITIILGGAVFAFALGYGLASKELVGNILASGYTKNKLNIGDNIKLNQIQGTIVDLDRSAVTILTNNSKVIIPLNKLLSENLEILQHKQIN